jgi:hypothetical protein
MESETVKKAKELLSLIKGTEILKENRKREEVLFHAEDLTLGLAEFIKYRIDAEQDYRRLIKTLQEEKELSFAAAENIAMTTNEYAVYKKTKLIYELGEEQIRILKIYASSGY